MLLLKVIQTGCLMAVAIRAQLTTISLSGSTIPTTGLKTEATLPTGSYLTFTSTITVPSSSRFTLLGTMSNSASTMAAGNITNSTTEATLTLLQGTNSATTSAINATTSANNATVTASSTSSSVQPTNTTPCNGFAEFCNRKYSNITMISAHNSPFIVQGSVASNQELDVTTQLNDGIRMLQIQSHVVNGTIYLCHTSCDILNAGTLTAYLTTVTTWVQAHPYDIVTILLENGDYVPVTDFLAPIQASGITQFIYTPPKIPMSLSDWPLLSSMILTGQRVVLFMDYQASPTTVPWILDEFSQMWETPFDPTNRSFPCTVQRPLDLSATDAKGRLFLVNHNLNQQVSLLGNELLIPLKPLLPETNNVSGYGSLGLNAEDCYRDWGRAPNFLNVDYYNNGSGTVFQVAAKWNNVTWNRTCCGLVSSNAEKGDVVGRGFMVVAAVVLSITWLLM